MTEPTYAVVAPTGRPATPATGPAWPAGRTGPAGSSGAGPGTGGRRIGFVWDHAFRGDQMFRIAEEELRAGDPGLTFVGYEAFGDIHGPDEARVVAELPGRLRAAEVDTVVVGVGA